MVDPNRKINRLNDKDIEFLDECEEEFNDRFSENDEDFMAHCKKSVPPPPIIENWKKKTHSFNKHDNRRGGSGYGNRYGGNYQHQRRQNSGGYVNRHDRNRYGGRNHPYPRNDGGSHAYRPEEKSND